MTTLTLLRQAMTDYLKGEGIRALSAWPEEDRQVRRAPLAVVQIQGVEAAPGGFQNYLGEVFDPESQTWTERYGQKLTLRFALDLYSPESAGEEGCRLLLDQVGEALLRGGPEGFSVEKWTMGEPGFDKESGMFRGRLQAVCRGVLTAVSDPEGLFLGFKVKGGIKT